MLVLANNNMDCVSDTQETLQRLFPKLRCFNLNNSGVRLKMEAVVNHPGSTFNAKFKQTFTENSDVVLFRT